MELLLGTLLTQWSISLVYGLSVILLTEFGSFKFWQIPQEHISRLAEIYYCIYEQMYFKRSLGED